MVYLDYFDIVFIFSLNIFYPMLYQMFMEQYV
jgi:hypothetical protein